MDEKPLNPELFEHIICFEGDPDVAPPQAVPHYETDITLRDLFAAAALATVHAIKIEDLAPLCYCIADAMLAEREKGQ